MSLSFHFLFFPNWLFLTSPLPHQRTWKEKEEIEMVTQHRISPPSTDISPANHWFCILCCWHRFVSWLFSSGVTWRRESARLPATLSEVPSYSADREREKSSQSRFLIPQNLPKIHFGVNWVSIQLDIHISLPTPIQKWWTDILPSVQAGTCHDCQMFSILMFGRSFGYIEEIVFVSYPECAVCFTVSASVLRMFGKIWWIT